MLVAGFKHIDCGQDFVSLVDINKPNYFFKSLGGLITYFCSAGFTWEKNYDGDIKAQ